MAAAYFQNLPGFLKTDDVVKVFRVAGSKVLVAEMKGDLISRLRRNALQFIIEGERLQNGELFFNVPGYSGQVSRLGKRISKIGGHEERLVVVLRNWKNAALEQRLPASWKSMKTKSSELPQQNSCGCGKWGETDVGQ